MVHGAKLEELNLEMPAFRNYADKLPCKSYPAVGNHENVQREADPVYEKAYWDAYGNDRTQYTFEHKGILFVVLNNSGDPPRKEREAQQKVIRDQRREFLESVFSEKPDVPKIIVCHIPLVPVRDATVQEKSFGFPSWIAHDDGLLEVIEAHSGSVLAVLSGHLHLTGVIEKNGVMHIVPSGLASYPHDIAVFDVFDDRIDVEMQSSPAELAEPYKSNIHGERRHKIDYVDAAHPTHELYVTGNPSERAFTIPLPARTPKSS